MSYFPFLKHFSSKFFFRLIFSVLFCGLIFSSVPLPARTIELLDNQSFDKWEEGVPYYWVGEQTTLAVEDVQRYEEEVKDGDYAVQLINEDERWRALSSVPVTVEKGRKHTIDFSIRGQGEIQAGIYYAGETHWENIIYSVETEEWETHKVEIKVEEDCEEAELVFLVRNTDSALDHLQLDEVSFSFDDALVQDTMSVFGVLAFIVGLIYFLSKIPALSSFFHYLPPVVWCYFLPMFATTFGIIPDTHDLYSWLVSYLLPFALILLLLSADIKAIVRLGPKAIVVMLFGTAGIVLGAIISYSLFRNLLGEPEAWKGVGALAGSWIGGSANLTAVAAGVDVEGAILAPFLVVDTMIAYSWMGVVIFFARFQEKYNKRFNIDSSIIDDLNARMKEQNKKIQTRRPTTRDIALIVGVGFTLAIICFRLGGPFDEAFSSAWESAFGDFEGRGALGDFVGAFGTVFSPVTWAVLFATAIGLILSFTPFKKMDHAGATSIGYYVLFMVLTGYGARADLSQMLDLHIYIAMGIVWILIHGIILFTGLRLMKVPLFFFAAGSQSNVGGPPSAAIVTSVYQPSLACVGILLGVLGSIIGTPVALLTATFLQTIAPGA